MDRGPRKTIDLLNLQPILFFCSKTKKRSFTKELIDYRIFRTLH